MAPSKPIGLSDYKEILIAHERDFRESRGNERQTIIQEVMEEMVAQSKGTLDKETMKGLDQVSGI
jgi:hypothetical protein